MIFKNINKYRRREVPQNTQTAIATETAVEEPVFACIREEVSGKVLWEGGPFDSKETANRVAEREAAKIGFKAATATSQNRI